MSKRKILFYTVTALLPFIILAVLEIGLRIFSFGDDLSLFVESSDPNYLRCNPIVGKRFFTTVKFTTPLNDPFLKNKPANGYRIFVLGESTVLGFPYDANAAFSRILQRRLQDVFPHRTIEVVNLGLTAVSSYALLDFADEILQQQPDAVLIYAGHNEYYGALGVASMENGSVPSWLKKFQLKLIHLRTYQLLQSVLGNIAGSASPMNMNEAKETLMQRLVGKNLIPYNSPIYKEGLDQFNSTMGELFATMKDAGVPVIVSDLVSNVKDLPPFSSAPSENYPAADPLYIHAKKLESELLFEKAKEEYSKAKDLDLIRFRASEDLNTNIAVLAASFGARCISLKKLFEEHSNHGIVGDNLMTEHLHPNIDGYFLMAEGYFTALKQYGMIEKVWDSTRIKPWKEYRANWGFTELDSMIAAIRIKHLKSGWPFQPDTTVNNFLFTYIPKNMIDSLAFMRVKYDNVSSDNVHKQLAKQYEARGDFKRASKEYLSIAYTAPYYTSGFYYAADFAVKAHEYTNAVRYLKESPNSDTSSYALYTLTSIYYSQKEFKEALNCIEKSERLKLDENNYFQIQKLKYQTLKDSGLASEAAKTFALLKKINPSFHANNRASGMTIFIPKKIEPYIAKAEELRKQGQFSRALALLKEANTVHETAYTNLLIGKILFTQKDSRALAYFEKASREIKEDPALYVGLSVLYLGKGEMSKAKKWIESLERIQGEDDPQVVQLKKLLQEKRRK